MGMGTSAVLTQDCGTTVQQVDTGNLWGQEIQDINRSAGHKKLGVSIFTTGRFDLCIPRSPPLTTCFKFYLRAFQEGRNRDVDVHNFWGSCCQKMPSSSSALGTSVLDLAEPFTQQTQWRPQQKFRRGTFSQMQRWAARPAIRNFQTIAAEEHLGLASLAIDKGIAWGWLKAQGWQHMWWQGSTDRHHLPRKCLVSLAAPGIMSVASLRSIHLVDCSGVREKLLLQAVA